MVMNNLFELLSANTYPGRGIMLGRSTGGADAAIAYFIMGRSENSRNRIFVPDGEGIRTQAHDPAKLTDPSLIIYSPVRLCEGRTVVTNGDQTDTICESLPSGRSFESALRTREFEPDAPNYTPRISGIVEPDGSYKLSILKSAGGDPSQCLRFFFEYPSPVAGTGHFISTYSGDGDPLPSFSGEPVEVAVGSDIREYAQRLWDSLNSDNKVSLFVRGIELSSGKTETIIFNRQEGD